jgi:hypothetical protein
MCGIGTKIVLNYFLESKPKVFHKSKEAPNIGCYVCYFHQTHPQIVACHLEPMITFIGPKKKFEKNKIIFWLHRFNIPNKTIFGLSNG